MGVLSIENVSKTYRGGVQALKDVNLTIGTGIYGLLGPNGAGKTTLMKIVSTLLQADSGSVTFDDIDVINEKDKLRQVLGYLPQDFGFYPRLTPFDLLDHIARIKGINDSKIRKEKIEILLEKTNLTDLRKRKLGSFSGGMKRRFGIVVALLNDPKLLVVDEPTAGLDPDERNRFHNLMAEYGKEHTVIFSTHIISDITTLCKNLIIINLGLVLAENSCDNLIHELQGKLYKSEKAVDNPEIQNFFALNTKVENGVIINRYYSESNPGSDFTEITPDLDDVYTYHMLNAKKGS